MNVIARINKVIKTLGLMGIMMALAGFLAATSAPASAAGITSAAPLPRTGQVVVYTEAPSSASNMVRMDVVIFDAQGNGVAKGIVYGSGKFSAQLPEGAYKVSVF